MVRARRIRSWQSCRFLRLLEIRDEVPVRRELSNDLAAVIDFPSALDRLRRDCLVRCKITLYYVNPTTRILSGLLDCLRRNWIIYSDRHVFTDRFNVLFANRRVITENLVMGATGFNTRDDDRYHHAGALNTWLSVTDVRI